jgi:hypothetical protein
MHGMEEMQPRVWFEDITERKHLEDIGVGGQIILKR